MTLSLLCGLAIQAPISAFGPAKAVMLVGGAPPVVLAHPSSLANSCSERSSHRDPRSLFPLPSSSLPLTKPYTSQSEARFVSRTPHLFPSSVNARTPPIVRGFRETESHRIGTDLADRHPPHERRRRQNRNETESPCGSLTGVSILLLLYNVNWPWMVWLPSSSVHDLSNGKSMNGISVV